jgi:hypothetical protein
VGLGRGKIVITEAALAELAWHRPVLQHRRTRPQAALDVEVHGADALGRGDVHVVEVRHPVGLARVDERGGHRVKVSGPFDVGRPLGTAELAGPVLPVLRLLEQWQDGVEVPAGVAGRRPDQAVDAPSAAEHLAERKRDGAASDVRARRVAVGPVVPRAEVFHPLRRVREAATAFARPAGLKQQDGGVRAVQQATGDAAAR